MYGYAGSSAAAATVTPFSSPPETTNAAGAASQAGAVAQASRHVVERGRAVDAVAGGVHGSQRAAELARTVGGRGRIRLHQGRIRPPRGSPDS